MHKRRIRWETMDEGEIQLSKLADYYLIPCRTKGRTASTLRGYRERLGRFIRWSDGALPGERPLLPLEKSTRARLGWVVPTS